MHHLAVSRGAQQQFVLALRVVKTNVLIGEQKVMRRNLAGHAESVAPRLPHCGERRRGCRNVGNVQVRTRILQFCNQANVALHDAGFGFGGHSAQTQLERNGPKVHAGAFRHARVFGVLDHGESDGAQLQASRASSRP